MKIRKFQIKFFLKIQKLFTLKILNIFDSNIYIVVFVQFVLFSGFFLDVAKINISNNQHIFLKNWRRGKNNKRNKNNERNENDDRRNNDDERRISKKKSDWQKFEFRKFSNCAKKTNAKKISKYFYFKFKWFEKKSIQKFLRKRSATKTKSWFAFFSWSDFWKKTLLRKQNE